MPISVNQYKQSTFPNKFNCREKKKTKTVSRKLEQFEENLTKFYSG